MDRNTLDRRRVLVAVAGLPLLGTIANCAAAQGTDEELPGGNIDAVFDASAVAVGLAELEIAGEYDTLYAAMHPDSRALVSAAGVAGWYESEFAPRQPGPVSAIVSSARVDWTWDVTDETYADTTEIAYRQPFGGVEEDVTVRLVRHDGFLTWFFGRDRAFVDDVEATWGDGVLGPGASPDPQVVTDVVSALDKDAVAATVDDDRVTVNRVEIIFHDQNSPGGAGAVPIVSMRAELSHPDLATTSDFQLSLAAYANSGLAFMNYFRNMPAGTDGEPDGVTRRTLADGEETRIVFGLPFQTDVGTHTSAQVQRQSVVIRAMYDGNAGDALEGIVVDGVARGLELYAAVVLDAI